MVAVLVCLAALASVEVPSAAAGSGFSRLYVDELFMGNTLERFGIVFQGRKVPVDNAACLGLRRFGVVTSEYGLDRFWRFRCTVNAASGRAFDVQLSVTHGPTAGNVYWHFLTVRRLY